MVLPETVMVNKDRSMFYKDGLWAVIFTSVNFVDF